MTTLTDTELLQSGYRYALSLTHHREDAEDLVQHAWFKLTKRYRRVENRAVLYTAIRNRFYDNCRRAKIVRFESIENAPESVNKYAVEMDFGVANDMQFFLSHLSADSREVLYLNCVEGFTAREISDRIGRPRGTVLSLLHRAKHKLKKLAEEQEPMVRQLDLAVE